MRYLVPYWQDLIGIVFLCAGFVKLFERRNFEGILRGYRLLPGSLVVVFSWILPIVELLSGTWLFSGASLLYSSILAATLSLVFAIAVTINLIRGNRNIKCGCFGSSEDHQIGWNVVARNASITLITVMLGLRDMHGHYEPIHAAPERILVFFFAAATIGIWSFWNVIRKLRETSVTNSLTTLSGKLDTRVGAL
jgi:hypothetical protein